MDDRSVAPRVAYDTLAEFIATGLTRAGMPEADARITGALMAEADLQGSDGHGSIRLVPYAKRIRAGGIARQSATGYLGAMASPRRTPPSTTTPTWSSATTNTGLWDPPGTDTRQRT